MIVGMDIGTTKICAIVAEHTETDALKIIGVGHSKSEGLRKGVVVNVEKTVDSIGRAVRDAELMAGVDVSAVYVGIAGDHIRSFDSRGVVAVSGEDNEITEKDQERVINHAKAVAIPMDREIIHVLPQEFIVDDQIGIKEPVGMNGVRLEAEVHIVTGAVTSAQNIVKSVRRAGIEVMDVVLEPLASGYAVLSPDEQELGVAIVDIGGGTTDIAVFYEGGIRHTAVIGLGGENVTRDITIGLRTGWAHAEEIKHAFGRTTSLPPDGKETISVPGVGGRPSQDIPRAELTAIIEPRMEEIFMLASREIRKCDYADMLAGGVVLTGGGCMVEGAEELADRVFEMPVRLGIPQDITGLTDVVASPMYSTGVGLLAFGKMHQVNGNGLVGIREDSALFKKILSRMKGWLREFF